MKRVIERFRITLVLRIPGERNELETRLRFRMNFKNGLSTLRCCGVITLSEKFLTCRSSPNNKYLDLYIHVDEK